MLGAMPDPAGRPGGPAAGARRKRQPTVTSTFGSGRREAHDASGFYGRFSPPELSSSTHLGVTDGVDQVIQGDARSMTGVADDSVALVVTSPPYNLGKEYEAKVELRAYLEGQKTVLAECARILKETGSIFW